MESVQRAATAVSVAASVSMLEMTLKHTMRPGEAFLSGVRDAPEFFWRTDPPTTLGWL